MRSNQINSPLLRLPAELRNKVYAYVFESASLHPPCPFHHHNERIKELSILLACRQLYHETTRFKDTFTNLTVYCTHDPELLLKIIKPEQCAALRSISVSERMVFHIYLTSKSKGEVY
jgi:hypothetical protein